MQATCAKPPRPPARSGAGATKKVSAALAAAFIAARHPSVPTRLPSAARPGAGRPGRPSHRGMIPMDIAGFIRSAATLAGQAFSAAQAAGSAIAPRAQAMLPPGRATSARTGCQRKEGTTLLQTHRYVLSATNKNSLNYFQISHIRVYPYYT